MLRYTVLRLLAFTVFAVIFLWLGVPHFWAFVFAALFSMVTSLFLLRGPRQDMAEQIARRMQRRRAARERTIAAQRTDEDDEDTEIGRPRR